MTAADIDGQTALMAHMGHTACKKMTFQMIMLAADSILSRPCFVEVKETTLLQHVQGAAAPKEGPVAVDGAGFWRAEVSSQIEHIRYRSTSPMRTG